MNEPLVTVARGLTPSQWEAVDHFEGPLLVLAGPGSGKTRVLTHRVARLLQRGVSERAILAMTFTNKAADEMAQRVAQLVPGARVEVRTFHSFCARLLRQWAPAVGLDHNFTIFDSDDQSQLLRQIVRDLDLTAFPLSPARLRHRISASKNQLLNADEFARQAEERVGDVVLLALARIYPEYQRRLLQQNAVDFDDLLLHTLTLLRENPEIRAELDDRYRFVLVDEFQDTNRPQYEILKLLAVDHPNVCVTGDPDQSIYGWRGACIGNILQFERDFPAARIVRLEHNFRSTPAILRAADALIERNVMRKAKRMVTHNPPGPPVRIVRTFDAHDEAAWIAHRIRQAVKSGRRRYGDFAVLYRVNAMSRQLETTLRGADVPYQVAAGLSFFERREVKDLLAFVRLLFNPRDDLSLLRIVNVPPRGIGKVTQQRLVDWARSRRLSLWDALADVRNIPGMSATARKRLEAFRDLMQSFHEHAAAGITELLEQILLRTGYREQFADAEGDEEALQRLANIDELLGLARSIDATAEAAGTDPLTAFLETTHLASDLDRWEEGDPFEPRATDAGRVTLMSLHAAKGLEFPVVFIIGVESGLLPHERATASGSQHEFEEERRLLFVGMTRAKEELYLTFTQQRQTQRGLRASIPSEFLMEIEAEWIEADDAQPDQSARHLLSGSGPASERRAPAPDAGDLSGPWDEYLDQPSEAPPDARDQSADDVALAEPRPAYHAPASDTPATPEAPPDPAADAGTDRGRPDAPSEHRGPAATGRPPVRLTTAAALLRGEFTEAS
ncbi:MAG: DNA helicase UvrD, partial [Planctomycetota bacterium]